jgi:hypothetical protein
MLAMQYAKLSKIEAKELAERKDPSSNTKKMQEVLNRDHRFISVHECRSYFFFIEMTKNSKRVKGKLSEDDRWGLGTS